MKSLDCLLIAIAFDISFFLADINKTSQLTTAISLWARR